MLPIAPSTPCQLIRLSAAAFSHPNATRRVPSQKKDYSSRVSQILGPVEVRRTLDDRRGTCFVACVLCCTPLSGALAGWILYERHTFYIELSMMHAVVDSCEVPTGLTCWHAPRNVHVMYGAPALIGCGDHSHIHLDSALKCTLCCLGACRDDSSQVHI